MSIRSVGNITIGFGLVNIQVKLYLAARADGINFRQINPKTGNPIHYVIKDGDDEINKKDLVKGYEYKRGSYVTFTEDEIKELQLNKQNTLQIKEFIPVTQLNPIEIEKSYHLNPDKGMDRAYRAFQQALKKERKLAVGTWIARGREHLVLIGSRSNNLVMYQMFYEPEIRQVQNTCDCHSATEEEVALASQLIKQLSTTKFDKSKYKDNFISQILTRVNTKLNNDQDIKHENKSSTFRTNSDVTEALRASLAQKTA